MTVTIRPAAIHPADRGDTSTLDDTLGGGRPGALTRPAAPTIDCSAELIADKGYHSRAYQLQCGRGFQGGRTRALGQGVRAFPCGGWLAGALPGLLRGAPAAVDAEAARAAVLAHPSDRHHMASAIQFLTRPHAYVYSVMSGDPRHLIVRRELVWAKAVHRVAAESISPEQAVEEALARIKQILAE
jgi:hypothetical protein